MILRTDDFHPAEEPTPGLGKPIRPAQEPKKPALTPVDPKRGIFQDENGKLQTVIPENEKANYVPACSPHNLPKGGKSLLPESTSDYLKLKEEVAKKVAEEFASKQARESASKPWNLHQGDEKPIGLMGLRDQRVEVEYEYRGKILSAKVSSDFLLEWSMVRRWRFV